MADVTSTSTFKEQSPRLENKVIEVTTLATAVTADTFTITLSDYGIDATADVGILGFDIENQVQEQPTWTTPSSGVVTVTVGGTANTAQRRYIIFG